MSVMINKWTAGVILCMCMACVSDPYITPKRHQECKEAMVLKVGGCSSIGWCGVLIAFDGVVWQSYRPVEGGVSRVCREIN